MLDNFTPSDRRLLRDACVIHTSPDTATKESRGAKISSSLAHVLRGGRRETSRREPLTQWRAALLLPSVTHSPRVCYTAGLTAIFGRRIENTSETSGAPSARPCLACLRIYLETVDFYQDVSVPLAGSKHYIGECDSRMQTSAGR